MVRAAGILRLLAAHGRPLTVTEIAGELALVPSTVMHILKTLAHEGLVAVEAGSKRYRLGGGIVELARAALDQPTLARLAQPHLERLAADHGVTALGIEWDGSDTLLVTAIACSPADFSVHANLGSRFPALTSATGRCFAAFSAWPDDRLRQAFAALDWHKAPSFEEWRADVAAAEQNGFAVDHGNYIDGMTVAAAPILDIDRRAIGAIAVLALSGRLTGDAMNRLVGDLKTAAKAVSAAALT